MAINKVIYGDETLIDLTSANATAETLPKGITAYGKEGTLLEGTEDFVKWSERKGYVGKNLIPYPYNGVLQKNGTFTRSGVTIEDLGDGRIKITGTCTNADAFRITNGVLMPYQDSVYHFTGRSEAAFGLQIVYADTAVTVVNVDKTASGVGDKELGLNLSVAAGVTYNHIASPMLRYASITDDTYEPYLPSNRELTEKVQVTKRKIQNTQEYFPSLYNKMNLVVAILTEFGASKSIYVEASITEEMTINSWSPIMLLPEFDCPISWNNQFMAMLHVYTSSDEKVVLLKGYSDSNQAFGLRPIKNLTLPVSTIRFYCEFIYTENTPV